MSDFPPRSDYTESLLLEAAIAKARADGKTIPHEVMRQRMLDRVAEARWAQSSQAIGSRLKR